MEEKNDKIVERVVGVKPQISHFRSFVLSTQLQQNIPYKRMFYTDDSKESIPAFNVYVDTSLTRQDIDKARFNVLRDDIYQ